MCYTRYEFIHPRYSLKIHSRELKQVTKAEEFTAVAELCFKRQAATP